MQPDMWVTSCQSRFQIKCTHVSHAVWVTFSNQMEWRKGSTIKCLWSLVMTITVYIKNYFEENERNWDPSMTDNMQPYRDCYGSPKPVKEMQPDMWVTLCESRFQNKCTHVSHAVWVTFSNQMEWRKGSTMKCLWLLSTNDWLPRTE